MGESRYRIERTPTRIQAYLNGDWDEPDARDYARALRSTIQGEKNLELIVDMSRLSDCKILARGALADLHASVRSQFRRSAYVADRARLRGVALWVIHVAEDENAKAVRDLAAAELWLESDRLRIEDAKRRLREVGRRSDVQ